MMTSIVVCLLIGMAVGLRFKVIFILPMSLVTVVVVVAVEALRHQSTWTIIAVAFASLVSLQIGYFVGSFAVGAREQTKAQEPVERNCNPD
jgi:hypothetical protein